MAVDVRLLTVGLRQQPWLGATVLPTAAAQSPEVSTRAVTQAVPATAWRALVLPAQRSVRFGHTASDADHVQMIRDFATRWQPRREDGYTLHNDFFKPLKRLSSGELQSLIHELTDKGSFSVYTDPKTGLVRTSDTVNAHMLRQWFTDSCMVGYLQRETDPKGWQRSMLTNAAALNSADAKAAIDKTEQDPAWYRDGDIMNGVFHIYLPSSVVLKADGLADPEKIKLDSSWFNQKRLESQALMLLSLTKTVKVGAARYPQPWGFTPEQMSGRGGELVADAMSGMARYLMAVNTNPKTGKPDYRTPSASSWEEAPFKEGMTWDAAVTVLAFEKLRALLETNLPKPYKAVQKRIRQSSPKLTVEQLDAYIQAGRNYVHERITAPLTRGEGPVQTPSRPADMSLMLLAASDYVFEPDNPLADAQTRLSLIQQTKAALLGENGLRRYNEFTLEGKTLHDSYLNAAFHFPDALRRAALHKAETSTGKDFGSTDASDLGALEKRQELSSLAHSAEWGLGLSAGLQGLAKVKHQLLDQIEKKRHVEQAKTLLAVVNAELLDFINRNIAAIPGPMEGHKNVLRADGTVCPNYAPMEAYEVVPDLNGDMKRIPGAHTLPWHAAQLYDGLQHALRVQSREEAMSL